MSRPYRSSNEAWVLVLLLCLPVLKHHALCASEEAGVPYIIPIIPVVSIFFSIIPI